jgi:hypothetical protein
MRRQTASSGQLTLTETVPVAPIRRMNARARVHHEQVQAAATARLATVTTGTVAGSTVTGQTDGQPHKLCRRCGKVLLVGKCGWHR